MDPGSTLLMATAATAGTKSYTFDADVPKHQAFALVANCSSGEITAESTTVSCRGEPGGVVGLCAGGHFHITVELTQNQRRRWGLALYRTSPC